MGDRPAPALLCVCLVCWAAEPTLSDLHGKADERLAARRARSAPPLPTLLNALVKTGRWLITSGKTGGQRVAVFQLGIRRRRLEGGPMQGQRLGEG
jgi:hypothetical protein